MRDYYNNQTLLAGDEPIETEAGRIIRPVSLASMLILKKLGNNIYNSMLSAQEIDVSDLESIMEFVWIHSAPWDEVKSLVARVSYSREQIAERVLDFAADIDESEVAEIVQQIINQKKGVNSAMAKTLPRKGQGGESKNEQRPLSKL